MVATSVFVNHWGHLMPCRMIETHVPHDGEQIRKYHFSLARQTSRQPRLFHRPIYCSMRRESLKRFNNVPGCVHFDFPSDRADC